MVVFIKHLMQEKIFPQYYKDVQSSDIELKGICGN